MSSLPPVLANSPYHTHSKTSVTSTLFIRKYEELIRSRKYKLNAIRNNILDEIVLKRLIFEIREMTMCIIEDGLELEYYQSKNKVMKRGKIKGLLPLMRYDPSKLLEEKSNAYIFNDVITDNEFIFQIPYVQEILKDMNLPIKRNPFFLSKNVDELASLNFNVNDNNTMGINALELLRFKRCADALIKAELQILNKVPLSISDIDYLWKQRTRYKDVEMLVRCVYTICVHEKTTEFIQECLVHLSEAPFLVEPQDFLTKLNNFKGNEVMLVNIIAAVRQLFSGCDVKLLKKDPASHFLVEWLQSALQIKQRVGTSNTAATEHTDESTLPVMDVPVDSSHTAADTVLPSSAKKRKIRSADEFNLGKIRQEINRSVKAQVEKALKDSITGKDAPNNDMIEGMRYELLKLQQELLKRKILNPLHYKAVSVDNTITDLKLSDMMKKTTVRQFQNSYRIVDRDGLVVQRIQNLHLQELLLQPLNWEDGLEGQLEVCLDTETESLVLLLVKVVRGSEGTTEERTIAAYVKIDKLEYNRLTGSLMDELLALPRPKRIAHLAPIFSKVAGLIEKSPSLTGRMYLDIDRVLYQNLVSIDGVAVNVSMIRDDDSSAIVIHCVPLQMSSLSHGIITLNITDKELIILLINQRSLFNLALTKWSSMEMVAVWLASRLIIKKIYLHERKPVSNQDKNAKADACEALHITVNRSVDLHDATLTEWRNRNTPHLPGVEVLISACQEEEMLRIQVLVQYTETAAVMEAQEFHELQLLPPRSRRDAERPNPLLADIPRYFEVSLVSLLTGSELMVFGKNEKLHDMKISLSSHLDVLHPASLIWNVLSRLELLFHNTDEEGHVRFVQDPLNWEVKYDRRLFKEIKTVSGVVMAITVSSVGGSLIFDAEPTQGAIIKEVGRRVFDEEEMSETVYAEGWPAMLLSYSERVHLGRKLLDRMKVVHENGAARLEPQQYAERRMLTIAVHGGVHNPDVVLGDVEIHEHLTLTDLRAIIKHELDVGVVPSQYRFVFRGSPCSVRQEPYRRAWECLPTCMIQIRGNAHPTGKDTGDPVMAPGAQPKSKQTSSEFVASVPEGRRGPGSAPATHSASSNKTLSLPPYPLPTLGRIQETSDKLYLLHDISSQLVVGDALKIGILQGRSYVVTEVNKKVVTIHPSFDLVDGQNGEPISTNCPFLNPANRYLFPVHSKLGFEYDVIESGTDASIASLKTDVFLDETTLKQKADAAAKAAAAFVYEDIWLWKCSNEEDLRPTWKREFDNGNVPYKYTYKNKHTSQTHFRVKVPLSRIEVMCVDARCPSLTFYTQRSELMPQIPPDRFASIVYKKMAEWYPQSPHGIDGSKWMKLLRETEMFSDLKKPARASQMDIIFKVEAKGPHGHSEKFVNYHGFCKLLRKIAVLRYPPDEEPSLVNTATGTPNGDRKSSKEVQEGLVESAYRKLILMNIASITAWLDPAWEEAKLMAMTIEARRYCAATRIIAFYRGERLKYYFSIYVLCIIALQSNIRRKLAQWRLSKFIASLQEDWMFRHRMHCAVFIQAAIRGWIVRCRYATTMAQISLQRMIYLRARRLRLKKTKSVDKKGLLYMKMRKVNRYSVLIKISRRDWRNFKDLGIVIKAYILHTQETFRFEITTDMLRMYMCQELKVSVVTVGDLLDPKHLDMLVCSRLMVRQSLNASKVPKMFFSTHGLGQQGNKAAVKGLRLGGHSFIVTLYTTVGTITASCYHAVSCNIFNAVVSSADVIAWVKSEFQTDSTSGNAEDNYKEIEILKPVNSKQLYKWLIENLVLDLRKQTFKIVFRCQLDKSRKLDYVSMIQRIWRGFLGRKQVVRRLLTTLLKVKVDASSETCYYLNRTTGVSTWEKPSILRSYDLPIDDKWMEVAYIVNGEELVQYVNPFRGRYTLLSLGQAARRIQSAYRNHMISLFRLSMYDFQRVLMIIGQAKVAYDKDPSKLMTVVNFAIVAHFVDENERLARVLYRQALDLSDSNPLVIRAYAIFLLGICEAPVAANREKGIEYFADANRRDKTLVKFDLAYLLLKYAVYVNPRKSQALLNLALAEHFVYKNKLKAEKCLRRALVLDPFNERMVELWKYFKGLYNERANLYYPPSAFEKANTSNGSKKSLKQGRTVLEDPSWAGWCYVERDEYGLSHAVDSYWFHITSGESSWTQPDFEHEWKKRMLRSKFEGAKYGMEYYFDPYTSTHFQYHPLSDTYR